jgi:dTDP-4-dehydrorhamnose 3,5-epimerase
MEFQLTSLDGLFLIKPFFHTDARGSFIKTFHAEEFANHGLENEFRESFYSTSIKGAIRGMHFQLPPHDHAKLVFATSGEVLDVVVDLRKSSKTYGQYASFNLSGENRNMLYIPRGMAHGFCALTDGATVFYFTSTVHSATHETGIRYDSLGYNWPVANPVVSERDKSFPALSDFNSPF